MHEELSSKFIAGIVDDLNHRSDVIQSEAGWEDNYQFAYITNGYIHVVTFCDIDLWDSEDNDCRLYHEELDEYEPLSQCIKRKYNELITQLNSLLFVIESGGSDKINLN